MNQAYKEQTAAYTKKDGALAIVFWFVLMALYTLTGLYGGALFGSSVVSSIAVNIVLALLCIALVLARKQGLSSVGISKNNILPSLSFGLLLGAVALLFNNGIVPALLYGWPLAPVGSAFINFLYQLAVIGFTEELVFRGYVQTRLYGLFKKDIPAMAVGGLLFSLMHVPFQLASGNRVPDAGFFLWLVVLVFMHLLFNFIYRRHSVLWGVSVFHALNNTSGSLFIRGESPLDWSLLYLPIAAGVVVVMYAVHFKRMKNE